MAKDRKGAAKATSERAAMLDSEAAEDKSSRMFGLGEKNRRGLVIAFVNFPDDFLGVAYAAETSALISGRLVRL